MPGPVSQMVSECCNTEVRHRYCSKCGQECRVKPGLGQLVKRWRKEANDLSRLNRFGRYPDQSVRVRQHIVLTTLRRCANALQKQIGGEDERRAR